jgi:hypothetical protein
MKRRLSLPGQSANRCNARVSAKLLRDHPEFQPVWEGIMDAANSPVIWIERRYGECLPEESGVIYGNN